MEIWIFGLGGYSPTSDLDLGKKVGNSKFPTFFWKFGFWGGWGGYSPTSDLDLGKKVGNLDLVGGGGGVFSNFGFGLRKKSWKFGFGGGVVSNFLFGLRKKSWKFGFLGFGGGILQLRIWT